MALNYIYKKYKDVYTIENTGVTTLSYTISTKNCDDLYPYKSGIIGANQIFILPITFTDKIYVVSLVSGIEEEVLPEIVQFNNTLSYIIKNVEEVLCGCKNCNCGEGEDECSLQLNTLVSMLSFVSVNTPKYSSYLALINDYLKCTITENLSTYTSCQQLTGKQKGEDLLLQIVGLYYSAFYYTDLHQAIDNAEIAYVKNKYKYNKISNCLKKAGINIADMESVFFDYPVYYWQLSNANDDISDVLPLLNEAYLATKPVDTFKVFNQGKIINYSLIGRVVFTIKNADSENFILMDSLGNDITDQFDTNYSSTTKYALFVSKIFYSYGNIYFKFKQQNI